MRACMRARENEGYLISTLIDTIVNHGVHINTSRQSKFVFFFSKIVVENIITIQ